MKKFKRFLLITSVLFVITSCAMLAHWGDKVNQALTGVSATMNTYSQDGTKIDEVKGKSFQITRDERFDSLDIEGYSKEDSQVLMISVGGKHISHVGTTLVLAEDGLENIMDEVDTRVEIENLKPGIPFINNMIEKERNKWVGKSKLILIRSQDGLPVASYSGNRVEVFKTDVPKSTWFEVDGKMLFVYRADYTVFDTDLLN